MMQRLVESWFPALGRSAVRPEAARVLISDSPRPKTGFFHGLSPDQKKKALDGGGLDAFGTKSANRVRR